MKSLKNKKGFTLIEMIISLAILAILAAAFLGVFTSGYSGILSAGKYSQTGYVGQRAMENRIAGISVAGIPNVTSSTVSNASVSINFGVASTVTVTGKIELINCDDGKHKVELATFIPN